MNKYLKALQVRLNRDEFSKLKAIDIPGVHRAIYESIDLCNPTDIFVCSDTPDEVARIRNMAIVTGEESAALAIPGHTFHFDGSNDQGRDRAVTRLLVPKGDSLSEALNQMDRDEGIAEVHGLCRDAMKGRTMIVRFLTLGPADSEFTVHCLECTDSWYVSHSVDLLYRKGYEAFRRAGPGTEFFNTLHTAGRLDDRMMSRDYKKKRIYIDYSTNTVYSVNNQYAGNSIGFKKLALRLAIRKAHQEGWLAEHFMIMGVYGPDKRKTYIAGAFPSACGKTSTAMLPGETMLADDIGYVRNIGGICRAVNIECGIFGIIQDINPHDDPLIHEILTSPGEIIFSNVLIKDARPWWLGMDEELPERGMNYTGEWFKGKTDENGEEVAPAHKNARYTVALKDLANCDPELENPAGVELGGILYGGRDYRGYVPVQQGFDWEHGIVAYGAALETETTFATVEAEGKHEINIMSIQDFISIPLGQYLHNYLQFGKNLDRVPLVFGVNYFLRDMKNGDFLNDHQDKHVWVKWMELRINNDVDAIETPTGFIPKYDDLRPLFKKVLKKNYSKKDYIKQFTIRVPENLAKLERVEAFYHENIPDLTSEVWHVLREQRERLLAAQEKYGDYISPYNFIK
ncbi:MAG TPA: phosphoenolpyruvate carboxykinase (GTP) [Dehalococcoidia bacterium]|nr:phosphoenolpyruvate carboxykinase (GTP) [Dehalococcoidia bacterium]